MARKTHLETILCSQSRLSGLHYIRLGRKQTCVCQETNFNHAMLHGFSCGMASYFIYLFILSFTAKVLKVCRTLGPKDVKFRTVCLKSCQQEKKSMMHQDSLEPASIRFRCSKQFTSYMSINEQASIYTKLISKAFMYLQSIEYILQNMMHFSADLPRCRMPDTIGNKRVELSGFLSSMY